jgi:hypothetical protein
MITMVVAFFAGVIVGGLLCFFFVDDAAFVTASHDAGDFAEQDEETLKAANPGSGN